MIPMFSSSAARRMMRCAFVSSALIPSLSVSAQVTYTRAERLLSWNTSPLISGDSVRPQWLRTAIGSGTATRRRMAPSSFSSIRQYGADALRPGGSPRRLTTASDTASTRQAAVPDLQVHEGRRQRERDRVQRRQAPSSATSSRTVHRADTLPSDVPFVKSPDKKVGGVHSQEQRLCPAAAACAPAPGSAVMSGATRCSSRRTAWTTSPTARRSASEPAAAPAATSSADSLVARLEEARRDAHRRTERGAHALHLVHAAAAQALLAAVRAAGRHGRAVSAHSHRRRRDEGERAAKVPPRPNQLSIGGLRSRLGVGAGSNTLKVSFNTRGSKSAYLGVVDASTGDMRVVARDTGKDVRRDRVSPQDPVSSTSRRT